LQAILVLVSFSKFTRVGHGTRRTHCRDLAAAVTGFISTIMAVPISIFIGRFISDTALPSFVGFSICGFSQSITYLKK
jgi:uncharacterized membrane protein